MTDTIIKTIFSKKIIYCLIVLLILFTLSCLITTYYYLKPDSSVDSSVECKDELGCLNDKLFKAFNDTCANSQCEKKKSFNLDELAQLAKIDYDQVVYVRRFQHDFSQSCGALEINKQHIFADECSYLVFSKGKKMTGYARGNCFSSSYVLEHLDNNFWFGEKNDKTLLNQRIQNQPVEIGYFRKNGLSITFSKNNSLNSPTEDKNIKCFSSFHYQSP